MWEILILLRCYDNMDSSDNLQLKALIKRTVTLFIILRVLRQQDLFILTADNIIFKESKSHFPS